MFKILALDGGGIRGVYTAAALAELEKLREGEGGSARIMDYFDLVVGTSTGGIIALGVALGIPAATILEMYERKADEIFPEYTWSFFGRLKQIFASKYDDGPLKRALLDVFREKKVLGDVQHSVAIPAFNASSSKPIVFKHSVARNKTQNPYHDFDLVSVAMATSAAPTYFSAHQSERGTMLDGGVWANCPAMVGVTEAVDEFDKKLSEISVLSVGTITASYFVKESRHNGGQLQWAADAATLVMHASKLGVLSQVERIAGDFFRLDEVDAPGRLPLDGTGAVPNLAAWGRHSANEKYDDIKAKFLFRKKPKGARAAR